MKKYSAIVPIYNVDEYLRKCVNSLISQNRQDMEIILVDDGSTDNCGIICDEYANNNKNIKVVHKTNGGIVSARKAGLQVSEGEYIICVDGDDWVLPNYVNQFDEIIQVYNPDIVCCGYIQVFPNKEIKHFMSFQCGFYNKTNIEEVIFPALFTKKDGRLFSPMVWAKVFKRSLLETIQMEVSDIINIGEDGACSIPCVINANSLYIIDECNYCYRYNPKSITKEKKPFAWIGVSTICNHFQKTLEENKTYFDYQFSLRMQHSLFNVSYSQFYQNKKYTLICDEINYELSKKNYEKYILTEPLYDGLDLMFIYYVLRYRLYFVMKLYSMYKRIKPEFIKHYYKLLNIKTIN